MKVGVAVGGGKAFSISILSICIVISMVFFAGSIFAQRTALSCSLGEWGLQTLHATLLL